MKTINKTANELAVDLVKAWLDNESNVSNEIGKTALKGTSISVKEIAQAYLDFSHTIINYELPEGLKEEIVETDTTDSEG